MRVLRKIPDLDLALALGFVSEGPGVSVAVFNLELVKMFISAGRLPVADHFRADDPSFGLDREIGNGQKFCGMQEEEKSDQNPKPKLQDLFISLGLL